MLVITIIIIVTIIIKSSVIKDHLVPAFHYIQLWCWRWHLRVPCTDRRSNQSTLKEINTEYSLERLVLKLKLQYFAHLIQRADSLERILMLGKIKGNRRRGRQRMRWLDGITGSMDMSWANSWRWWKTGKPGVLQTIKWQRVGHDWLIEQQLHCTLVILLNYFFIHLLNGDNNLDLLKWLGFYFFKVNCHNSYNHTLNNFFKTMSIWYNGSENVSPSVISCSLRPHGL